MIASIQTLELGTLEMALKSFLVAKLEQSYLLDFKLYPGRRQQYFPVSAV